MARMTLQFDGLKDLSRRIDEIEGSIKPTASEALTKVQEYVQGQTRQAAARYAPGGTQYSTGRMQGAIKPNDGPKWSGDVASVGVGFIISQPGGGGMHSIWRMYGTPRAAKDTKLYNAIRGARTQKQVTEIMQKTFLEHARL